MSRRPHPYFRRLSSRELPPPAEWQRVSNSRVPLAKPSEEPGILWEPFRETRQDK